MKLETAQLVADRLVEILSPHCERIQIAGSIRRRRPDVNDIEIVAIPKPYGTGLLATGIATVVNQWPKVKGELPCKYTRRAIEMVLPGQIQPELICLDLFLASKANWGSILAIRTGSARYVKEVLAAGWSHRGYRSEGGILIERYTGCTYEIHEEWVLFAMAGVKWIPPEERE